MKGNGDTECKPSEDDRITLTVNEIKELLYRRGVENETVKRIIENTKQIMYETIIIKHYKKV